MQEYQERVLEERQQLNIKIEKLAAFLNEATSIPTFRGLDFAEEQRLVSQLWYMRRYSDVLAARIANFK